MADRNHLEDKIPSDFSPQPSLERWPEKKKLKKRFFLNLLQKMNVFQEILAALKCGM